MILGTRSWVELLTGNPNLIKHLLSFAEDFRCARLPREEIHLRRQAAASYYCLSISTSIIMRNLNRQISPHSDAIRYLLVIKTLLNKYGYSSKVVTGAVYLAQGTG